MAIWVTRSSPDNLATARRLRSLGHGAVLEPVLHTLALRHRRIDAQARAIIFTSVHAVRHHRHSPAAEGVPIFVTSNTIAAAALRAGYRSVTATGGNDAMLHDLVAFAVADRGLVIQCCSDRTSRTHEITLRDRGIRVERREVYRVVDTVPDALHRVAALAPGVEAIVVHSTTGAAQVRRIVERTGWRGDVLCISVASADRFAGLAGVRVATATRPTEEALLALVRDRLPRVVPPPRPRATGAQVIRLRDHRG